MRFSPSPLASNSLQKKIFPSPFARWMKPIGHEATRSTPFRRGIAGQFQTVCGRTRFSRRLSQIPDSPPTAKPREYWQVRSRCRGCGARPQPDVALHGELPASRLAEKPGEQAVNTRFGKNVSKHQREGWQSARDVWQVPTMMYRAARAIGA